VLDNEWHHFVGIRDFGNEWLLYLDGEFNNSESDQLIGMGNFVLPQMEVEFSSVWVSIVRQGGKHHEEEPEKLFPGGESRYSAAPLA
jgi:hypothetical protein